MFWYVIFVLGCIVSDIPEIQQDACGQCWEATSSFKRCLDLRPFLRDVRCRYETLGKSFNESLHPLPRDDQIHEMRDCEIKALDGWDDVGVVIENVPSPQATD